MRGQAGQVPYDQRQGLHRAPVLKSLSHIPRNSGTRVRIFGSLSEVLMAPIEAGLKNGTVEHFVAKSFGTSDSYIYIYT
jgi:hypothetical protein